MKKNFLTATLSIALITFNLIGSNIAYAKTIDVSNESSVSAYTESDTNVTKEEAGAIVGLFVDSQIKSDTECPWTKNTKVKNFQVLYDENDSISGYTFELETNNKNTGYVTIGNNLDYNFIHEFSYSDEPAYDSTGENYDKVYYTGPLNYYVENHGKIKSIYPTDKSNTTTDAAVKVKVSKKDELTSGFKDKNPEKKKKNLKLKNVVDDAIRNVDTIDSGRMGTYNGQYSSGSYVITNLTSYLDDVYDGYYYLESSKSLSSVPAYLQSSFEYNANNCTLTSLTALAGYWRDRLGYSGIPYSKYDVYDTVHDVATWYGYTADDGTWPTDIDNIAEDAFSEWGYDVYTYNVYCPSLYDIEDEILDGYPCVFNITWGTYSNHSILVWGYRNYDVGEFLRVYDNWSTSSRYIDWDLFDSVSSMTVVNE